MAARASIALEHPKLAESSYSEIAASLLGWDPNPKNNLSA